MAGAIAVQQHDDVVNLSTISHKKTGYRFAFGKYVIQVYLWHLFGERSSISNQPYLYKRGSTSVAHNKRENLATFHALHRSAIGIDVHSNLIVATYQNCEYGSSSLFNENRGSGASKPELDAFASWCKAKEAEVLIMESTGVYWQSLYESLENVGFTNKQIVVVNARDVKNKRGSKTDLADAIHLAEVARQETYRASFVPAKEFRQLRCLWRSFFTLKISRKRFLNIMHKQLCQVGCRASSVFSDIRGKKTTKIIDCLINGEHGETLYNHIIEITSCKQDKLKATPQQIYDALQADMESEVWFAIRQNMEHIKFLDAQIAESEANLRDKLKPYTHPMKLLTSIPGIKDITAMGIICELGDDISQFTSIRRFCKWIGLAPGNNESAGKKYSGRTTPGNKYLKVLLVEAVSGIVLMKKGFLHEVLQRFKERRGTKKSNVALAHKMCRIIFSILTHGTAY